ncbi:SDR family oxidoreductase [Actinoplanes sp. NPDC048796]|uniref:SDR family NAD(P)-dependent oxidoreductase n=1 Tax=Actinoplanes sp. NPDC048796 TaxID=3155640 RepID=UPI0033D26205
MTSTNKTAIVTGSTSGIGAAIARALAADGITVLVTGRDATRGRKITEEITGAGHRAVFVPSDLAGEPARVRAFAAEAREALGGTVDILVNNAGIYVTRPTPTLEDDDLDRMLAVNIRAPYVLVAELAPAMAERGRGAIVNVGSWMSRTGLPFGALYTATKAADEQLTRAWAAEFGPRGVRVNAVAPGITLTEGNAAAHDMAKANAKGTPAGVPVQPDDVAFLVSDRAAMVQGTTLDVDGGLTATRLA